jgi:asparagine synthase (glutamine-hydrolysing)
MTHGTSGTVTPFFVGFAPMIGGMDRFTATDHTVLNGVGPNGVLANGVLPSGADRTPVPVRSRRIWAGYDRLFTAGDWPSDQCVSIEVGDVRAVLLGVCPAGAATATAVLAEALRRGDRDHSALLRLDGNFNLIVRDGSGLHVYADLASLRPIYYTRWQDTVAYASRSLALRQLTGAAVDRDRLAASLCLLSTVEAVHDASLFTGIDAVPGGHRLFIGNGRVSVVPYWSPTAGHMHLAEGAVALRHALGRAVTGRITETGRITADISGGFDSTTIALLAADHLAGQGRELIGLTFGSYSALETEDNDIAQVAAASRRNIDHVVLSDDTYPLPYGRMD